MLEKTQNTNWLQQAEDDKAQQEINEFGGSRKRLPTTFYYSDGLPGTRKTSAIINVTDQKTDKNIGSAHAVPSKLLCAEVESRHQKSCRVINSDTVSRGWEGAPKDVEGRME